MSTGEARLHSSDYFIIVVATPCAFVHPASGSLRASAVGSKHMVVCISVAVWSGCVHATAAVLCCIKCMIFLLQKIQILNIALSITQQIALCGTCETYRIHQNTLYQSTSHDGTINENN